MITYGINFQNFAEHPIKFNYGPYFDHYHKNLSPPPPAKDCVVTNFFIDVPVGGNYSFLDLVESVKAMLKKGFESRERKLQYV